eukprot:2289465-Amphidinium_carterae.1
MYTAQTNPVVQSGSRAYYKRVVRDLLHDSVLNKWSRLKLSQRWKKMSEAKLMSLWEALVGSVLPVQGGGGVSGMSILFTEAPTAQRLRWS